MGGAWLWARADIRRRWLSLLVVALLLAFGAGSTMALVAGARRADSAADRFKIASDSRDLIAFVGFDPDNDPTGAEHEQGVADLVAALEADQDVQGFELSDAVVVSPDPVTPGTFGFTFVGQPGGTIGGFGTPILLDGRYATESDEIVVNERSAEQFNLRVGDRRPLLGLECFDCQPAAVGDEVTITGIVRLDNDLVDDPSTEGLFLAAAPFIEGRWADWAQPGTIITVQVVDGADPVALTQRLSQLVTNGDVGSANASLDVVERAGVLQRNALLVAAATVGLVGLLVVAQSMSRHVAVRRADEPVLAGLGLGRTDRLTAAGLSLAPAVVVGTLVSIPLAIALSPLLPLGLARRADPDVGVHVDVVVVCIAGALTALFGLFVVLVVARRWLVSAVSEPASASPTVSALASLGIRPVALTGARFALERGSTSSRLPVRTTIAVAAVSIAVVCAALVVRSSLDGLVADPARYGQDWVVRVGQGEPANGEPEDLATFGAGLAADSRVEQVDLVGQGGINLVTGDGVRSQITTLGISGVGAPTVLGILAGRAPNGPGELALGTETMRQTDIDLGDEVGVEGPCGKRSMVVVGRTIVPLIGSDNPDVGSVIDLDEFDALCADQSIASIDQNSGALVRLHDGADAEQFSADLAAEGRYSEPGSRPSAVTSLLDIRGVPLILAVLVSILGVSAVGYALVLTVRRRRSDLAIVQALGFTPAQAGRVLTWQAAVMGLLATVIGVPLGIVAGRLTWSAIARGSNVVVRFDVPAAAVIAVVGGAILLVLLASIWPNHRARNLEPARVLRGE